MLVRHNNFLTGLSFPNCIRKHANRYKYSRRKLLTSTLDISTRYLYKEIERSYCIRCRDNLQRTSRHVINVPLTRNCTRLPDPIFTCTYVLTSYHNRNRAINARIDFWRRAAYAWARQGLLIPERCENFRRSGRIDVTNELSVFISITRTSTCTSTYAVSLSVHSLSSIPVFPVID